MLKNRQKLLDNNDIVTYIMRFMGNKCISYMTVSKKWHNIINQILKKSENQIFYAVGKSIWSGFSGVIPNIIFHPGIYILKFKRKLYPLNQDTDWTNFPAITEESIINAFKNDNATIKLFKKETEALEYSRSLSCGNWHSSVSISQPAVYKVQYLNHTKTLVPQTKNVMSRRMRSSWDSVDELEKRLEVVKNTKGDDEYRRYLNDCKIGETDLVYFEASRQSVIPVSGTFRITIEDQAINQFETFFYKKPIKKDNKDEPKRCRLPCVIL